MVVHIVGFALSYPLYLWRPWAGVVMVVATGALPWVAVLLANDGPPRKKATMQQRVEPLRIDGAPHPTDGE